MTQTQEQPEKAAIRPAQLLTYLPGTVALTVAVIYTVGAIVKVSEVNAAGFDAAVVLPLTPIQQLLAIGISGAASTATVSGLVTFAIFVAGWAWYWDHMEHQSAKASEELAARRNKPWTGPPPKPISRWRYVPTSIFYYAVGPLLILLFVLRFVFTNPPPIVAAWVIVLPSALLVGKRLGLRARDRVATAFVVTLIASMTAFGLAYPSPLPYATLVTTDGSVIGGRLLTTTDSATTIGLPDCHIQTVPAAQIRSLNVGRIPNRVVHVIGELLFDYNHNYKPATRCS